MCVEASISTYRHMYMSSTILRDLFDSAMMHISPPHWRVSGREVRNMYQNTSDKKPRICKYSIIRDYSENWSADCAEIVVGAATVVALDSS